MKYIEVDWNTLKSFITGRGLSIQWLDVNNNYHLFAFDGIFTVGMTLAKNVEEPSAAQVDFETNFKAAGNKKIGVASPFASKTLENKKLYKRVHGISAELAAGANTIIYTIPYQWVKINGIEVINGESGDAVSFYILDSTTGTYSTIPNYTLNQFAFDVNIAKDYYEHKSEFDADLYQGMQVKIVYNSLSVKTVGINFLLNELKT